ncbi:MAG: phosphopantothenoylcysteine decarboxylase/phosphopantothenate--cysteine ligase [Candidatus Paceibacteria bacterium]|jgi:phosphopantothenoylcysteine decarboxylase/phosphopantothenate--cysteine ligase
MAKRRRVVVTAGPTREHVDPVRYLTNESSGRMGFAIAKAAAAAGCHVTLVAGPVDLLTPKGVKRVDVVSARDMLAAVREAFQDADALFMAAAVSDWRPRRKLSGKWRKKDDGEATVQLDLVRNPDILKTVAARKGDRLVVGFALETADGLRRARGKMKRKGTDFVVLNDASALSSSYATVIILGADGSSVELREQTKDAIAKAIVALGC